MNKTIKVRVSKEELRSALERCAWVVVPHPDFVNSYVPFDSILLEGELVCTCDISPRYVHFKGCPLLVEEPATAGECTCNYERLGWKTCICIRSQAEKGERYCPDRCCAPKELPVPEPLLAPFVEETSSSRTFHPTQDALVDKINEVISYLKHQDF